MYKLYKTIRKIALGFLCLVFVGCSYTPYRYSFSLIEPQNETMSFNDNNVQFRFVPTAEYIRMSIKNMTDQEIFFARDNAEYIDSSGVTRRIHYGNDYVDEVLSFVRENKYHATPMKIEPDSVITGNVWINIWPDFCIGESRNSSYSYEIYNLMEPFFPRYSFEGRGQDLKGSTFNLVLPIDSGGYVQNYSFAFMINDLVDKSGL